MPTGMKGFDAKRVLNAQVTEDDLLTTITEAATLYGWRWHHVRRSDKAIQMGHSGFPDLVLAKAGVVFFVELKRESEDPRPDQVAWMDALNGPSILAGTGGAPPIASVGRPSDVDAIIKRLAA